MKYYLGKEVAVIRFPLIKTKNKKIQKKTTILIFKLPHLSGGDQDMFRLN
jgi:hypothetical protein